MTTAAPTFFTTTVPCCMGDESLCACSREERVLRAYAGGVRTLPPMSPEEREWCLEEIDRVEGYKREDYEQTTDADLANGVLHAWTDFCRDKGLL